MYKQPQKRTLTIAAGATDSDIVDVGDYTVVGIFLTGANTGSTATFKAALTASGTPQTVKDSDGNSVSVATAAAGAIGLSGAECDAMAPWRFIQMISASSEASARTITLVLK